LQVDSVQDLDGLFANPITPMQILGFNHHFAHTTTMHAESSLCPSFSVTRTNFDSKTLFYLWREKLANSRFRV